MNAHRNRFLPRLESLESRDTPSNLAVTFANHTLTIRGETDNTITVEGDVNDATQFSLSSSGSDTFNGNPSPYSSSTGVKNISFALTGSGDTVHFDNAIRPIDVEGNLSIDTGTGANTVIATDLTVGKNFSITNGINSTTSPTSNFLINLNVGGNLTIDDLGGDTNTVIYRSSAGVSTIGGNLSITNGTGYDYNSISDTNIDGNATVSNGSADASGNAGYTQFFNLVNGVPSVIKGNLSVSYLTGNGISSDGIFDTVVEGNLSFNHGAGNFTTDFDGGTADVPVRVGGNVTLTGTGFNTVTVGTEFQKTGMIVGKNFSVTSGSGTLTFNRLQVGGATALNLGNGIDTVTVDQSTFAGTFAVTAGDGTNVVDLANTSGDTAPTEFDKAVHMKLNGAFNEFDVATAGDVLVLSTFDITASLSSVGADVANVFFPFGGTIVGL